MPPERPSRTLLEARLGELGADELADDATRGIGVDAQL